MSSKQQPFQKTQESHAQGRTDTNPDPRVHPTQAPSHQYEMKRNQVPYQGLSEDVEKMSTEEKSRRSTTTAYTDDPSVSSESKKSDSAKIPEDDRERISKGTKPSEGRTMVPKPILDEKDATDRGREQDLLGQNEEQSEVEKDYLRQKKAEDSSREALSEIKAESIKSKQQEQERFKGKQPYVEEGAHK